MSRAQDFETNFAFGVQGEHFVADWLMRRGNVVAPLYQFENSNGAPALFSIQGAGVEKTILPDLTCFSNSKCWFAEVKRKNRWAIGYRSAGSFETGFNSRHLMHYERVAKQTGMDVWLFFLHESSEPTGLFTMRVGASKPRFWNGKSKSGDRSSTSEVFWLLSDLKKVAELNEVFGRAAA